MGGRYGLGHAKVRLLNEVVSLSVPLRRTFPVHEHPLDYVPVEDLVMRDRHYCNVCQEDLGPRDSWRCGRCDFDLCLACASHRGEGWPCPAPRLRAV